MPEPLPHPLRAEADRAYIGVRRDRGPGLYLAKAKRGSTQKQAQPDPKDGSTLPDGQRYVAQLLRSEERDGWQSLIPTDEGLKTLEVWLAARAVADRTYLPFRERTPDAADMALICEGVKKTETGGTKRELEVYRMAVAGRAAYLLRTKDKTYGGGLYLCSLMIGYIEQNR